MGVLRARVGGAWVDIVGGSAGGGGDEVFVGPNDPGVGAGYDMWYDTDAPSVAAGGTLPSGGTAGQVLTKNSTTSYDASWVSGQAATVPRFRVMGGGSGQSLSAGVTVGCTWAGGSEAFDNNNMIAIGTGIATIPAGCTGRWRFDYCVYYSSAATGNRISWLSITASGTRYGWQQFAVPTTVDCATSSSVEISLTAGDQLQLWVNSAQALTINQYNWAYFQGCFVGA